MKNRPKLRLVRGGLDPEARIGAVRLVAAPEEKVPFPIDAKVEEEATYLVLSADAQVREPREPLMRVLTEVLETQGETPGTVVVQRGQPLRLLAVIHDLAADPTWKEEWIAQALDEILRQAQRRQLRSLALPLLGTVHGRLERLKCLELIHDALGRASASAFPERIWLRVPEGAAGSVARDLRSFAADSPDRPDT